VRSLGFAPERGVAMVGDDLWSDVEGAQRAGLQGWLVRTGKFRDDALRTAGITPDRILSSVAELR
jgi:ribonucleotide monophosphatase NagD (HAD superfamily)